MDHERRHDDLAQRVCAITCRETELISLCVSMAMRMLTRFSDDREAAQSDARKVTLSTHYSGHVCLRPADILERPFAQHEVRNAEHGLLAGCSLSHCSPHYIHYSGNEYSSVHMP